jgi:hypothetical protein
VVEWRRVRFFSDQSLRVTFSLAVGEDGTITYRYGNGIGTGPGDGRSATVGMEDLDGNDALEYGYNTPVLTAGLTITIR